MPGMNEFLRLHKNANEQLFGHDSGLVQVHLPIHKATRHEKFFNRINALFLHHQLVVHHIEHTYHTICTYIPFGHPCIKTIAFQIIEPIHIQLAGNKLVHEGPAVGSLEDIDGKR